MGVKSLWSLLTPVGRPLVLENMEGKAMAIDSSIWIYQFQATMRDKDGRALVNAHVLGFLRRICKLLFYGIRPVFVFDGGAPALKRSTIRERKQKKSGAAESHAKLAEKLLAAQLRREALNHANPSQPVKGKGKAPAGPVVIDEDVVYLEDVDPSAPKTPAKKEREFNARKASSASPAKNRFHDHDPYRLPFVDLEEAVAKATLASAPDPRLATEEELRSFIEDMRPEDFDVTSPAFRELPTEVQYEIVGDLRLKSRQTSYARLQNMLKHAPTPLDFSRQQIQNLKQRNLLTQQLLTTTDSIGKAHISIPVRIASERNKQYVLMKNEGEGGGWILGITDEGTQSKPIEIDVEKNERESDPSDVEMEEITIPNQTLPDPDLRAYRQEMALSAINNRLDSKLSNKTHATPIQMAQSEAINDNPLFDLGDDEGDDLSAELEADALSFAIQDSLDIHRATKQATSQSASTSTAVNRADVVGPSSTRSHLIRSSSHVTSTTSTSEKVAGPSSVSSTIVSLQPRNARLPPSRSTQDRDTAYNDLPEVTPMNIILSMANTSPRRMQPSRPSSDASIFGEPFLLVENSSKSRSSGIEENVLPLAIAHNRQTSPIQEPKTKEPQTVSANDATIFSPPAPPSTLEGDSEDELEEVIPPDRSIHLSERPLAIDSDSDDLEEVYPDTTIPPDRNPAAVIALSPHDNALSDSPAGDTVKHLPQFRTSSSFGNSSAQEGIFLDEDEGMSDWSGPSSLDDAAKEELSLQKPLPHAPVAWDAAQEMDSHAEQGEFARFMSQVKGKDLEDVRREIDDEIKSLNQQRKAAMRDSEDITQQMISQIMMMLRLFGIPYITAPMEAEAQCAELVQLGLVEGIITDDSDVFLFGGLRVFKNMFNQSKTVECFLLSDLGRELGLDRDTLVRLAYLLGSDYVEGLPGVGPVVAMELLKEFPGEDGLHKFKDWWLQVQSGKDRKDDNPSKFRKRFKKRFKDLFLPADWPNPAVRDAYYHPTVDSSEEPFKWGLPDLDALRDFFREELGWNQVKVDDLLLPIIQKMSKRRQTEALNKQGNLDGFLDVSVGGGNYAPRKRQAYASKRLQEVVTGYRGEQAKLKSRRSQAPQSEDGEGGESGEEEGRVAKKARTVEKGKARAQGAKKAPRGGARKASGRGRKAAASREESTAGEDDDYERDNQKEQAPPPLAAKLRPRPKPA